MAASGRRARLIAVTATWRDPHDTRADRSRIRSAPDETRRPGMLVSPLVVGQAVAMPFTVGDRVPDAGLAEVDATGAEAPR